METKSFYDVDYIIEISEKRLEQYISAYQKVLERLTILILIYSMITIFLIPIIQNLFFCEIINRILLGCFIAFAIPFIISITYSIRLIFPVKIAYLGFPKRYYEEYRIKYEQAVDNKKITEALLKASYITELEIALAINESVFRKKSSFYYNALIYGLLSVVPYLICIGFHITVKEDKVHKIELVRSKEISNL